MNLDLNKIAKVEIQTIIEMFKENGWKQTDGEYIKKDEPELITG